MGSGREKTSGENGGKKSFVTLPLVVQKAYEKNQRRLDLATEPFEPINTADNAISVYLLGSDCLENYSEFRS